MLKKRNTLTLAQWVARYGMLPAQAIEVPRRIAFVSETINLLKKPEPQELPEDGYTEKWIVDNLPFLPSLFLNYPVQIDPSRELIFQDICRLHLGASVWLRVNRGERELLREAIKFHSLAKAYADWCEAILIFCNHVYPKLEFAQKLADSDGELWGFCVISRLLYQGFAHDLHGANPPKNGTRTISKDAIFKRESEVIANYKKVLQDDLDLRIVPYEYFDGQIIETLLTQATHKAREENDINLERHCKQFLGATSHYNRITLNEGEGFQLHVLEADGKTSATGLGKRTKIISSSEKKRGRGRPKKGSNR